MAAAAGSRPALAVANRQVIRARVRRHSSRLASPIRSFSWNLCRDVVFFWFGRAGSASCLVCGGSLEWWSGCTARVCEAQFCRASVPSA